jgi:hypothetical protein
MPGLARKIKPLIAPAQPELIAARLAFELFTAREDRMLDT